MQTTPAIFKAYDIRGIVPSTLNEDVALGLVDGKRSSLPAAAAQLTVTPPSVVSQVGAPQADGTVDWPTPEDGLAAARSRLG